MPRRKQDRPKRMKWEESSNERSKDEDGNGDDVLSLGPSSKDRTSDEEDSTANPDEDDDEVTEKRDDGGAKKKKDLSSIRFPNMQEVDGDVDDQDQVDDKTVHKVDVDGCDGVHPDAVAKEPLDGAADTVPDPLGSGSPSPARSSPRSPAPLTLLPAPMAPVPSAPPASIKEEDFEEDGVDFRLRDYGEARLAVEPEDELEQDGPLDFSVKKSPTKEGDGDRLMAAEDMEEDDDAPLDLSLSRKRPLRPAEVPTAHHRSKALRLEGAAAAKTSGPWSTQFPFRFSPSASPNSGVDVPAVWNGGVKSCHSTPASSPSPSSSSSSVAGVAATHSAAEHHQYHPHHHQHHHQPAPAAQRSSTSSSSPCGRHNAWQSHWLSRGAEQAKDVLKCVWCRKSFRSLEEMTAHMKEARHCGMQLQQAPIPPPPHRALLLANSAAANNGGANQAASPGAREEPAPPKEAIPMPRKLVRGQDVWLGKGAEQTKQILKCMWCGQSFKTLAEMTTHMQQTQHYTNIISQEQIISWKSPEDRCSNQAHVNAVLTCKVCDQAFSSLKELSNHMVKNSHYKEHILRSITENGGRRRQTREKRKKSLPVRKLLELERAQNEMTKDPRRTNQEANGRITCEKCGKKIDTQAFVEHIRLCVGGASPGETSPAPQPGAPKGGRESGSPPKREHSTPSPAQHHPIPPPAPPNGQMEAPEAPSVLNAIERLIEKSFESKRNRQVYVGGGAGSNGGTPLGTTSTTPTPHSPAPKKGPGSPAQHSKGGRRTPSSKDSVMEDKDRNRERHRRRRRKHEEDEEEDGDDEDDGAEEEDKDKSRKEDCQPSPNGVVALKREASPARSLHSPASTCSSVAVNEGGGTLALVRSSPSPGSPSGGQHPLRELQKLLDKTNVSLTKGTPAAAAVAGSASPSATAGAAATNSAFSWACSDAEAVLKCAFCDTPFVSKGAYRHHLAKMHFVKDGQMSPPATTTAAATVTTASGPLKSALSPLATVSSKCAVAEAAPATSPKSPLKGAAPHDESPHSKFLKYTELAKQLSSKYV